MSYRLLHLITHLGVGGAQDYMLHAARHMDRSRFNVHIAAGTHELDWAERAQQWSDKLHLVPRLRHEIAPADDTRVVADLVNLMRRERYNVVHTHSSKAGALGRLAARIAGVPVIVHTVHGFSWTPLMKPHTRRAYQLIERVSARYTSQVLAVCESNAQELADQHIVPAQKITTIYNGIDAAYLNGTSDRQVTCAELGLDPERPIVGMVGRLAEQKAPLDFVAAAKYVLRQRPDVQFVVVGDGPLRAQIEAAIIDVPQISLLGARSDMPALLRVFDVFAAASLWEGLSRAVAEAMLVRCPVAATAVNGTPELIVDNVTGLLSPARDPERLAVNILRLINDPTLAQQLANRGFERVKFMCSVTTMVRKLDLLYETLILSQTPRRFPISPLSRKRLP